MPGKHKIFPVRSGTFAQRRRHLPSIARNLRCERHATAIADLGAAVCGLLNGSRQCSVKETYIHLSTDQAQEGRREPNREAMSVQKFKQAETDDVFWSDSYRGHVIATLNHGKGWLVYLDHVLQHGKLFVTAEAAVRWLRRRIDAAPHAR
jgi:hypothetical protein